ncbi:MAG: YdeI/OmpD-associated family protein [Bacteroidetes bacterium]|nr:YdeI/OmpD-associated family protein [Bacteroidota bacterium]
MAEKDPRIDAYIAKSADFAKPILTHLRDLIHAVCPDVKENIKWSVPHFDCYDAPLCSVAAFKNHCAINLWKAALIPDRHNVFGEKEAAGQFGKITSLKDLPADKIMIEYLKEAVRLNKEGVKLTKPKSTEKKELIMPEALIKSLAKNKKAQQAFEALSYSHKKEYIDWITEAKTEDTRTKRIATTMEWVTEGKSRNWKYEKKK